MKYTVKYSSLFKKSFKKCIKRGFDENKFKEVVLILANEGCLPPKYKPHKLKGNYSGIWAASCCIENGNGHYDGGRYRQNGKQIFGWYGGKMYLCKKH